MATPTVHSGQVLGRYLLLEQIGAGGMGVVFKARDQRLSRDVAIKLLAPGSIRSVVARHRVRNEAMALSRLSHPNIETIFEFDSLDDRDFLVVELIPGVSLDELIAKGPIPQTLVVSLAVQLLRGLAAAHEKGIIHRDLKPSNLRLTPDSFLKILDFGIAHVVDETQETNTRTTETYNNVFSGTLTYMSPEQLRGTPIDPRSDLYSVGLLLYQMCTGRLPFTESGAMLIDAILNRAVPPPSKLNPAVNPKLEAVIIKALQKDPKQRYQSAREMLADLEALDSALHARHDRRLQIASLTVLVLILAFITALERRRIVNFVEHQIYPVPTNRYVAVMRFRSVTNDDPAFDEGLTEAVAAKLMEITASQPVQVVSPRELEAEGVTDVQDARKKLGINLGIEGTLLRSGETVRVTQELIDATTRRMLRVETFDTKATDVFALQDQLVDKAVQMLEIEIHQGLGERGHGTTSSQAFTLYTRGRGFLQRRSASDDTESALAQFKQAILIDPGYAAAHASLGLAYLQKYQLVKDPALVSDTATQCEKAGTLSPQLALANVCLGVLQLTTGNYEKAVSDLQQALEKDPTDDEAYGELATAYEKLNQPTQAEETYKKAIKARPQYAVGYERLGFFYRNQARYQESEQAYLQAVHAVPEDVRAWAALAGVYYFTGEYEKAVEATQRAIAIRPSSRGYNNLGNSYLALRRFSEAIEAFRQAVAMNGHEMNMYTNLARAYYFAPGQRSLASEQFANALAVGEADLKVNPRDADARTLSAYCDAMLGRRREALDHLRNALLLRPNDAEVLYFAAMVNAQLGNSQEAISWLKQALSRGYSRAEIDRTLEFEGIRDLPEFRSLSNTHN